MYNIIAAVIVFLAAVIGFLAAVIGFLVAVIGFSEPPFGLWAGGTRGGPQTLKRLGKSDLDPFKV